MSFTSFNDRPLRTREEIARQVHAASLRRGLDELATVIALMTIATEVGFEGQWWCPSNAKDPTSKNYPHDSESNDGRSVGYFQQQNGRVGEVVTGSDNWWGSMQSRMTLDQAADMFLSQLAGDYGRARTIPRWRASSPNAFKAPDSRIGTRSTGTRRGLCFTGHWQPNQHRHQEETWDSQATPYGSKTY